MSQPVKMDLLDDLEDDLICLKYAVSNFSGTKGGNDYKELKTKLMRIHRNTGEIKSEDVSTRRRVRMILEDIKELYAFLRNPSTTHSGEESLIRTYYPDIEENINLDNLVGKGFEEELEYKEVEKELENCESEVMNTENTKENKLQQLDIIEEKLANIKNNFSNYHPDIISKELDICRKLIEGLKPENEDDTHRTNVVVSIYEMLVSRVKVGRKPQPIPRREKDQREGNQFSSLENILNSLNEVIASNPDEGLLENLSKETNQLKDIVEILLMWKGEIDCFTDSYKSLPYIKIEHGLKDTLKTLDNMVWTNKITKKTIEELKDKSIKYLVALDDKSLKVSSEPKDNNQPFNKKTHTIINLLTKIRSSVEVFDERESLNINDDISKCGDVIKKLEPVDKQEQTLQGQYENYLQKLILYNESRIKQEKKVDTTQCNAETPKCKPRRKEKKVQFKDVETTPDNSFQVQCSLIEKKLVLLKDLTVAIPDESMEAIKELIGALQPTTTKQETLKALLCTQLEKLIINPNEKRRNVVIKNRSVLMKCCDDVEKKKKEIDGFNGNDHKKEKQELDELLERILSAETKSKSDEIMKKSLEGEMKILISRLEVIKKRIH